MYKEDLALNNLQWIICHKTQRNQPNLIWSKYGLSRLNQSKTNNDSWEKKIDFQKGIIAK